MNLTTLSIHDMKRAGYITKQQNYIDFELRLAIEANKMVLAYFEGQGEYFGLITSYLRQQLEQLKGFESARNSGSFRIKNIID